MKNGTKIGSKNGKSPPTWQTQHEQLGFPLPRDANGNPRYNDTSIIAKVAALPSLDAKDLRALWQEYFGEEAPRKKRDYLIPRLAWRIQELAYGGLSDPARARLEQLMRMKEIEKKSAARKGSRGKGGDDKPKKINRPAVGTRLVREYHGVEHHVTVTRNGFEYQGRTFRSLSHIAKEITGAHWSGPLFFGLVQKDRGSKKRRRTTMPTGKATATEARQ